MPTNLVLLIKSRFLLMLTIVLLLLQSGCWGGLETDEVAYIISMGFDKGEKDNLIVTFSIANPKAMAGTTGGGGGQEEVTLVSSVEATAPVSALDLMNTATTRRLSLLHTKAYIFSEELAREGLAKWLAPLNRLREFRETANVYVVRGKASDFLNKNKPLLEVSPSKQFELITLVSELNGFFMPTQFFKFYERIKTPSYEASLPLIAIHEDGLTTAKPGPLQGGVYEVGPYLAGEVPIGGKNIIQFIGTAVFMGDKMIGTLTGTETRIMLMLMGKFNRATINLPDPIAGSKYFTGLNLQQERLPSYHTEITKGGNVRIEINLFIEADIVAISSGVNYENVQKKQLLEDVASKAIEEKTIDLVRKCQEDYNTDIFGFGTHVKYHFLTTDEWEKFKWGEKFKDAEVNVKANVVTRRTGLQIKTNPLAGD